MKKLTEMNSQELKAMAKDLKVKSWWTMNKKQLIEALSPDSLEEVKEEIEEIKHDVEELKEEVEVIETTPEVKLALKKAKMAANKKPEKSTTERIFEGFMQTDGIIPYVFNEIVGTTTNIKKFNNNKEYEETKTDLGDFNVAMHKKVIFVESENLVGYVTIRKDNSIKVEGVAAIQDGQAYWGRVKEVPEIKAIKRLYKYAAEQFINKREA